MNPEQEKAIANMMAKARARRSKKIPKVTVKKVTVKPFSPHQWPEPIGCQHKNMYIVTRSMAFAGIDELAEISCCPDCGITWIIS